jgi:uncharacterized RDD family membrane protein YckC
MPCAIHSNVLTELSTCSRCGKSFCGDCIITLRGAVVCAGCKGAMVQDVKSGSMEGELELAGRGARLGAAIIDGLVQGVACVVVLFVVVGIGIAVMGGTASKDQSGMILVALFGYGLIFFLMVAYEGWMLSKFNGQTLGKKALGIKVVAPDGGPITTGQAWGRGGARLLLGILIGGIDQLFIFSKNRTTLHDRMAKTRVVMARD